VKCLAYLMSLSYAGHGRADPQVDSRSSRPQLSLVRDDAAESVAVRFKQMIKSALLFAAVDHPPQQPKRIPIDPQSTGWVPRGATRNCPIVTAGERGGLGTEQ
jgi:hypothetical protein